MQSETHQSPTRKLLDNFAHQVALARQYTGRSARSIVLDFEEAETILAALLLNDRPASLVDLDLELSRARTKFPGGEHRFPALAEEVGELSRAICDNDGAGRRLEAIQVAATAIRIADEGTDGSPDAYHDVHRIAQLLEREARRFTDAPRPPIASSEIRPFMRGDLVVIDDASDEQAVIVATYRAEGSHRECAIVAVLTGSDPETNDSAWWEIQDHAVASLRHAPAAPAKGVHL